MDGKLLLREHGRRPQMTGMRRARISLLATAIGVWSAAIVWPLAGSGSATVATPPNRPTAPMPVAHGRSIAVDPGVRDGGVHHPLSLMVQAQDVNGTPLVTTATPTGYNPTTIKKYLGMTGTGANQTIAIVVAYDAPTIAADLAKFDSTYGIAAPPSFKKVSQTGSTSVFPA